MSINIETLQSVASQYPLPAVKFTYGTAGFRTKADLLEPVMFRMGLLAALRSKATQASIGVMITASHNPVEDNGVKLIDPMGEMLKDSWESYATSLANCRAEDLGSALEAIVKETGLDLNAKSCVCLARDTRPSGLKLAEAVIEGAKCIQKDYQDYGILSTPQLHYIVRCINTNGQYGEPTEEGYYRKLSNAFLKLQIGDQAKLGVKVDGANGVGADKIKQLQKYLGNSVNISVFNDGTSGKLNDKCGADYVKINQCLPEGIRVQPHEKCVSFDGDADRILYFYIGKDNEFKLLDGDKMSTLIASFIKDLLSKANLKLNLGVIQTAYANGRSTEYLQKSVDVPVSCVKTGVKHLHHKALEYDIGVYFEANGHGTVIFSDVAVEKIKSVKSKEMSELLDFINLVNETVGDAISDFLVIETILNRKGYNLNDWNSMYSDLPNRQLKVKVKDRTVIKTIKAETETTSPEGLQEEINKLVSAVKAGRSFVRPSGTEDVVRVYAEAETRSLTDELAYAVANKVYDFAGGVGPRPQAK
ncbi:Phosphoacetylglucosamine mutase [Trichoplax sp. H2]|nr:Phosphoacetylglucosamine mutase [Trichoplax sp. H2]|eukprot:RDD37516.1 Phosphoacetylglucosamine mutase [Trichoplax sp. H2]